MHRAAVLASLVLGARLAAAPTAPPGDWILWYDQPATAWEQALPVGNGRLGAMVFGGGFKEKIQFNEHTVWSGKPHDYSHKGAVKSLPKLRELLQAGRQQEAEDLAGREFMSVPLRQMAYQPCGDLLIETPGNQATDHRRWLDLDSGLAVTEWTANEVTHRRETFASHPANLIVTRLSSDRPGNTNATLRLACPHRDHTLTVADSNTLVLTGKVQADGVAFEARALVIAHGGTLTAEKSAITVGGADAIEIRLTAATNVRDWKSLTADPAQQTRDTLARTAATDHATLLKQHLADHGDLFRKVSLDLGRTPSSALPTHRRIEGFRTGGDPQLAALLFQFGRYLLIGSSREGGQPATLQGIWNANMNPLWESKYTSNVNTQMNYWLAESTQLSACHRPLFQALAELRESGTITAREHYGARGWVLHHNFDLWRGTAPTNLSSHGIWPTGGAWLSMHLWEHFLYSGDQAFLRQVWPVMRDAALFFTDFMVPDPTTKQLVSGPSNSPEQGGLVMGPAMDHQIIRELFKACSQAATILGTDAAFAAELDRLGPRIAPHQIGKQGQLQEWQHDKANPKAGGNHLSHLWTVFPGAEITWHEPELFQAARQALVLRGDGGAGMSLAWKTNLWARFLDGDHAYLTLSNLLQPTGRPNSQSGLYPDMLNARPPFQIDGNLGVTSGIAEMLLQSHVPVAEPSATPRFVIHLLPALPKAWPTGSVTGLRARGGLTVDLAWRDGKLTTATLTPTTDGPIAVRLGDRTKTLTGKAGQPLVETGAAIK